MSEAVVVNGRSLYGFRFTSPDRRRVPIEEKRSYTPKQLWQRSHEILNMTLLGHKVTDIAEKLGITRYAVSAVINSKLGMEKLAEMREERDKDVIDVAKEVEKLYPKAVEVYQNILNSEDASLSMKKRVADTVLMDIGGHRAPTKMQGQFAHAHVTSDEIKQLRERGKQAAREAGIVVDVGE